MYRIGVDVGSAYVKICVMENNKIVKFFSERTPLRQKEFFEKKIADLKEEYTDAEIVTCGYGRQNVNSIETVNELSALAKGAFFLTEHNGLILDVGGQDTKIINQSEGRLKDFFLNDKCAAGSGSFLAGVLERVSRNFDSIDLRGVEAPPFQLSSVCAVFAQSEIVELIAANKTEEEIIQAVIWHIYVKAKALVQKCENMPLMLSGGLSGIPGIDRFAEKALGRECYVAENGKYLASVGCALWHRSS